MADENAPINQDEIERLLQQRSAGEGSPDDARQSPAEHQGSPHGPLNQDDIEAVLSAVGQKSSSSSAPTPQTSQAAELSDLSAKGEQPRENDVDEFLKQAAGASSLQPTPPPPKERALAAVAGGEEAIAQGDVEYLLSQAQRALDSIDSEAEASPPPGLGAFEFEEFTGQPASSENATLDLISDVHLDLKIELGRTNMYLEDVLKLRKGSVVALDKLAGDPVDIYVNERLIARGEVLVLNDNFCVRVGELIAGSDPDK